MTEAGDMNGVCLWKNTTVQKAKHHQSPHVLCTKAVQFTCENIKQFVTQHSITDQMRLY